MALVFVLLVAMPATAKKKKEEPKPERIVFPPLPAKPVIEYLGSIKKATDFTGKKKSFFKFLVGEEEREPQLIAPTAVAIGPRDVLYVVDQQLKGVVIIDQEKGTFELFKGTGAGPLQEPIGVAVAPDGTLYVSDAQALAVYVYDPEGNFRTAWGGKNTFVRPTALAISAEGDKLAVCDTKGQKVFVLSTANGEPLYILNEDPQDDPERAFRFPYAVTFDEDGYMYVADYLNYRIQVYEPDGAFEMAFGQLGDRPGDLNRPRGLAAIAGSGIIFEVDGAFQLVQMFNMDGELLMWFGSSGEGPSQFSLPSGIALRGDLLVVADTLNSRVQSFRFLGAPDSAE
jgi:DNA-binding beta-propeller fold protein YncE